MTADQIANIRRKYRCELESLLSVDEGARRVIRALRARGRADDTLIATRSDNGFFHGEHRIPEGKQRIYEESIRVPLAMRGPGIPRGVKVGDLAINADLAPTIVDVANANPGLVMDGRSLIPVARRPGIERADAELLVEQPSFAAIRTKRYMYAEHDTGEEELYDLRKDPFELRSRHNAPAYASVKAQLATRLHELADLRRPQLPGPSDLTLSLKHRNGDRHRPASGAVRPRVRRAQSAAIATLRLQADSACLASSISHAEKPT